MFYSDWESVLATKSILQYLRTSEESGNSYLSIYIVILPHVLFRKRVCNAKTDSLLQTKVK